MANVPLIATFADQTATQAAGAASQLVPPGAIMSYGGANAPTGWLLCDGAAVSRTVYANLFAAIGTAFGVGDGSTTFNLPDMRGRFVRYDDNMGNHGITGVTGSGAASRDTGRVHGSAQTQTTAKNGLSSSTSSVTGVTGTNGTSSVTGVTGTNGTSSVTGSTSSSSISLTMNPSSLSGTSGATDINHTHPFNQYGGGNSGHLGSPVGSGFASPDAGNSSLANVSSGTASISMNHSHSTSGIAAAQTLSSGTASGQTIASATAAAQGWTQTGSATAAAQGWTQTGSATAAAQTITGDTETRPINIALNAIIKI